MIAAKNDVPRVPFSAGALKTSLRAMIWELPLPFLIIGGIYGGFFTASEAAAVMCAYAPQWRSLSIRM